MRDLVRDKLEIEYKGETKTLEVTLSTISEVSREVNLMGIATAFADFAAGTKANVDFVEMAMLVHKSLALAGFKVGAEELNEIFNEMLLDGENGGYMALMTHLLEVYMPKGKPKTPAKPKPKRKPRTRSAKKG